MFKLIPRTDKSDPNSAALEIIEFSQLDFEPKRMYWMRNFVQGKTRGNHAHMTLRQIFIVMQGRIEIELTDGQETQVYNLSSVSPYLSIEPGLWRVISRASADAILLVLADRVYDEEDYIRDWDDFIEWRRKLEE